MLNGDKFQKKKSLTSNLFEQKKLNEISIFCSCLLLLYLDLNGFVFAIWSHSSEKMLATHLTFLLTGLQKKFKVSFFRYQSVELFSKAFSLYTWQGFLLYGFVWQAFLLYGGQSGLTIQKNRFKKLKIKQKRFSISERINCKTLLYCSISFSVNMDLRFLQN